MNDKLTPLAEQRSLSSKIAQDGLSSAVLKAALAAQTTTPKVPSGGDTNKSASATTKKQD